MSEATTRRGPWGLMVDFFAAPTTGAAAAAFRVAFGLLSLWVALGLAINLDRWFGFAGAFPWRLMAQASRVDFTLISLAPDSDAWLMALVAVYFVAGLCVTVGLFPRAAVFVVWVLHISFHNRNIFVGNGGDRLFGILAFLAVFMPLADRWSVHTWWRRRQNDAVPVEPSSDPDGRKHGSTVWSLRLVQMQIVLVYFVTGVLKLEHRSWLDGSAMRGVFSSPIYAEWPFYITFEPLAQAITWTTLAFELGFILLVWIPRLTLPVLAFGFVFHLAIDVMMMIPMFSWVMIVSYLVFIPDATVEGWVQRLQAIRGEPTAAADRG